MSSFMAKEKKSKCDLLTGTSVGQPLAVTSDSEEVYEVECVLDHRVGPNGTMYKVRWYGWTKEYDEWVHCSKMDCPDAIKEYWERKSKKRSNRATKRSRTSSKTASFSKVSSSKSKRKLLMFTKDGCEKIAHGLRNPDVDSSDTSGQFDEARIQMISDTNKPMEQFQSIEKTNVNSSMVAQPSLPSDSEVASCCTATIESPAVLSQSVSGINVEEHTASVDNPFIRVRTVETLPMGVDETGSVVEETNEAEFDASTCSSSECVAKGVKKPLIRPHGFERGLTVERIHGFVQRADHLFAVVQFKNCDVIEFLSTKIVQHYEPMALIRGFEEHHIRCRRRERSHHCVQRQEQNPMNS